jgi:alpha(1,3/1,4) fucosyltransferase
MLLKHMRLTKMRKFVKRAVFTILDDVQRSLYILAAAIILSVVFWPRDTRIYILAPLFAPLGEYKDNPGEPLYGCHLPTIFKEYGIEVISIKTLKKAPRARSILVFDLCNQETLRYLYFQPKEKMVLFLWEPPTTVAKDYDKNLHKAFAKIFTWDDDLVDNKRYFKFYYPVLAPMERSNLSFQDKKLCVLMSKNGTSPHPKELYSERKKIISFFEEKATTDLDFFGKGWQGYKTYKGVAPSKQCLQNYRFNICYENMKEVNGYITEKIFDSFHYGCVPVYLGANNIIDYIPKNCFIDRRDFKSDADLYTFLKNMRQDEHEEYLNNIQKFLKSDKAKLFSKETFLKTLKSALSLKDQDSI